METTTARAHAERLEQVGLVYRRVPGMCATVDEQERTADACDAGADALTRLAQVEAALSEAREKIRELRAELESAADRDSARVVEAHDRRDLGQRVAWLDKELAEARAETLRYREAIEWALGERDEFPAEEPPPLAGKYRQRYYWRTELRRRAALTGAVPEGTAR